jgi:hypothetical protein
LQEKQSEGFPSQTARENPEESSGGEDAEISKFREVVVNGPAEFFYRANGHAADDTNGNGKSRRVGVGSKVERPWAMKRAKIAFRQISADGTITHYD